MEKILLAMESHEVDTTAVDFACYIACLTRSKLTGVFFNNLQPSTPSKTRIYDLPSETIIAPAEDNGTKKCHEVMRLFTDVCTNRGVRCELICCDRKQPAQRIIKESRFADLVLLKAETSFLPEVETVPTQFVKQVLADAECPVIITPLSFNGIDEIIFTYDGSYSSVFAIKQFTYLFPQLNGKKATVLQLSDNGDRPVVEKEKIGEYCSAHYSGVGFQVIPGKAFEELFRFLMQKKNMFVVMGAYGHGMLAGLHKQSTAGLVLKTINCPFFIAHI